MIIVDLEQGSKEWKDFRRDKIGSSDAAAIMGLNPWKTAHDLWRQKIEGFEDAVNPAMQRGIDLEPIARKMLCERLGITFQPRVAVSKERPRQMASFDCLSEDMTIFGEIKCGGRELYEKALKGEIPPYYMAQCQHDFSLSSIIVKGFYACFYENNLVVLEVAREPSFIQDLLKKEEEFRLMVDQLTPPPLSERDYMTVDNDKGAELLDQYRRGAEMEKEGKRLKDAAKDELVAINPDHNFIINGVKVYTTQRASVDTDAMRHDGIDVDAYKKLSAPYWTVSMRASKAAV